MNLSNHLARQIDFILELDKLKNVMRKTFLMDKSRAENSAEHSWHISMIAIVLAEYAAPEVDINRVIRMLLIHDIVEIDAGDTFVYDEIHIESKEAREREAAQRIYGILPQKLGDDLLALWREFEVGETPDAIFAACIDRVQPFLFNYYSGGGAWLRHHVTADKVLKKMRPIKEASESLWQIIEMLIADAVSKGYLPT